MFICDKSFINYTSCIINASKFSFFNWIGKISCLSTKNISWFEVCFTNLENVLDKFLIELIYCLLVTDMLSEEKEPEAQMPAIIFLVCFF